MPPKSHLVRWLSANSSQYAGNCVCSSQAQPRIASRFPSICRNVHRNRSTTANDHAVARRKISPKQYEHRSDAIKLAQGPLSTTTFVQFWEVDRSHLSKDAHMRRHPARFACRCCVASRTWRTGSTEAKLNEISPKSRPTKESVSRRKLRSV